ncbi:MAG TPA: hypothetical protein VFN48_06385 [Solirubrobacteraceae bacterium]|nr:hypothetical protein [Solirubrobacteraceae bacterium]
MPFSRTGASLLSALALAGGGAGVALAATSVGASAATTTTATTTTPTTSTTPGAGGPSAAHTGTATISRTGAKGVTHTRSLKVRCYVHRGHLIVGAGALPMRRPGDRGAMGRHRPGGSMGRHQPGGHSGKWAHHNGRAVRLIVNGTKPGTHAARLFILRRTPTLTSLRHLRGSATLTAQGGTFTWSKTLSGKKHPALKGHTVKVTENWTCTV